MADYPNLRMYIGGEWRSSAGEDVINPFDESVLGTVPHATRADLDDALAAAEHGFNIWRATPAAKRASIIMKAAAFIRARTDDMGRAMTMEQGKTLASAKLEVARCYPGAEWAAAEGRRLNGRIITGDPGFRNSVTPQPIGVAAAFTPWNYPVSSPAGKVASALAAGCAVILKASEETPAGAVQVVEAYHEAGLPAGVLNLVFGIPAEISEYLIPSPIVRIVGFTGSVPVGKHLASLAGRYMKPSVMELGGHSPVIVDGDVDPEAVAAEAVLMKSRNAGQICVSPTRFYVHERIYSRFLAAFVEHARAIRPGNGLADDVDMGPLANGRRLHAIEAMVEDARKRGAKLLSGGQRMGTRGFLYPLTTLTDVPEDASVMNDEPFGPIATIQPIASIDEGIQLANRLPFGLAGYAFTRSAITVDQISDQLEVGNLGINHFVAAAAGMPFGGVKDSGYGREGGPEGVEHYTVAKSVSHKVNFAPAA